MPDLELPNGYYALPPGKMANVATRMEMRRLPERKLAEFPRDLRLVPPAEINLASYRKLFRAVGSDYIWFSRLLMPDDELERVLHAEGTETFTFMRGEERLGILELNYRDMPSCELAFFGLVPEAMGQGLGRILMDEAIRRAFARPIERFWLSTCTLDSPQALGFYQRSGFVPYQRLVEIHDDPRLQGLLPLEAAPQIPLIR
jgi:ribosomal protein S18 acetylase RimI-like enzyme